MAKFQVGQIVCTKGGKELPFRIIEVIHDETGIFYRWNRKNAMAETSVRALTGTEKGEGEEAGEIVVTVSCESASHSTSLARQIDSIGTAGSPAQEEKSK